ncbi:MAG: tetratricopeptide repeat protein [Polyangiaceae bacterium]|jgi:hypothetical protein|nr:tetratricopeptide repeat protein [Polyangiaceae bacterium]
MKTGSTVLQRSSGVLACAFLLTQAAPLGAQTSDEDARRHFEAGVSYFNTSSYEGALREFQRAYQLSDAERRPAILRNIASVYERMGDPRKTVETLEQYLREVPDAADRATIELRMQNLRKRNDAQKNDEPDASAAVTLPGTTADPTTTAVPPTPPQEPDYTPAYIGWGIGGVAAIGAVVTGLIAQSKYDDRNGGCAQTPTGCSDDEVAPVKTMAWISTALTGVAVVGAGAGTFLYLTAEPPSREHASGLMPRVGAGAGPKGGGVEATWRF